MRKTKESEFSLYTYPAHFIMKQTNLKLLYSHVCTEKHMPHAYYMLNVILTLCSSHEP